MKPDSQIREEILQELRWEPQLLDPDAIGVAVRDGAVTLTGSVSTYAQKLAAVRAASRVYGVKAVAGELKLKLAGAPQDDSDIAQPIPHVLEWSTQIPEGKVHAQVRTGWVTLDGEVEWDNQRQSAYRYQRNRMTYLSESPAYPNRSRSRPARRDGRAHQVRDRQPRLRQHAAEIRGGGCAAHG